MPTFGDSENIPQLLDEGDYIFEVVGFEIKISNGAKTRGSEQYETELAISPTGKKVTENLIDHPSTNWKIDCFLKAAGVKLAKGEAFEFREDVARARGVRWVNPMGLRGWCRLKHEIMPANGQYKERTVNKVDVFYTDKPKLEARVVEVPEEEKPF